MTKKRRNRPDVDSLLPDVDEEIQGSSSGGESTTEPENVEDQQRHDGKEARRHEDMSSLAKQLEVLMEGPATPYGEELPDLGARANGYLDRDVERALQQATSVLKNRFEGVSKSLIMNYAIRLALWDLRENAEASALVKWLKEVNDEGD